MKRLLGRAAAAAAVSFAGAAQALPVQVTTSLELSEQAQQVIAGQIRPMIQLDKGGSGAPFVDVTGAGDLGGYAPSFFNYLRAVLPADSSLHITAYLHEVQIDGLKFDPRQKLVTAHVSSLNFVGFPSEGTEVALFTTTAVQAEPFPIGLDGDNSQAPVPGTTFQAGTLDLYFTDAFRQLVRFDQWDLEIFNALAPGAYAIFNGEVSVGRLSFQAAAAPEPSTWALLGLGLAAAGAVAGRRRGQA